MGPAPPFRQGLGALTLSTLGSPLPHLAPGEYNPGPLNRPRGGGQLELPRRTLSTLVALQFLLRVANAEQDPGCNPLVTTSPPLGRETGRGGGLDEHAALLWLLRPAATRTASTSEPKQLVVVAVVMMMAMATRPTGLGFDLAATWLRLCLGLHPYLLAVHVASQATPTPHLSRNQAQPSRNHATTDLAVTSLWLGCDLAATWHASTPICDGRRRPLSTKPQRSHNQNHNQATTKPQPSHNQDTTKPQTKPQPSRGQVTTKKPQTTVTSKSQPNRL